MELRDKDLLVYGYLLKSEYKRSIHDVIYNDYEVTLINGKTSIVMVNCDGLYMIFNSRREDEGSLRVMKVMGEELRLINEWIWLQ